ncbi:MAG: hypothetical protein HY301_13290 [Verrucomicrobia bacterium]|nr:hypothetical protein [Verrucomicrobiota bacterium]
MKTFSLIAGMTLASHAFSAVTQEPTNSQPHLPGVSVSFVGFTDTGTPKTHSVFVTPTTNQTIFGPKKSKLPGPTNLTISVPGGPAAVFRFTNASPYPTFLSVQSLEWKSASGWQGVPPSNPGGIVRPNSIQLLTLHVHATNVTWRMRVACIEQRTGLSRTIERGKEAGNELLTGQKTERFGGRTYLLTNTIPSPSSPP